MSFLEFCHVLDEFVILLFFHLGRNVESIHHFHLS